MYRLHYCLHRATSLDQLGCCHKFETTKINFEGYLWLSMQINTPKNYPPSVCQRTMHFLYRYCRNAKTLRKKEDHEFYCFRSTHKNFLHKIFGVPHTPIGLIEHSAKVISVKCSFLTDLWKIYPLEISWYFIIPLQKRAYEYRPTPRFGLNFLQRSNVYSNMSPCVATLEKRSSNGWFKRTELQYKYPAKLPP